MSDGSDNRIPTTTAASRAVEAVVGPYAEGLDILVAALDLSLRQLVEAGITREELAEWEPRSVLFVILARTITTVDAIYALLAIGRVEQAEILNRTLMDLEVDGFLLVGDERAMGYYVDWASVEQARMALDVEVDGFTPSDTLLLRRKELAGKLLDRIDERQLRSRLDDLELLSDAQRLELDLGVVLPAFCRVRYGSKRPSSWKQGFRRAERLSADEVNNIVVRTASDAVMDETMPPALRDTFQSMLGRELGMLYPLRSAEVHHSPLSLNRLVDHDTMDVRIAGDIQSLPKALMGTFSHLHRLTVLFLSVWSDEPDFAEWIVLTNALNEWKQPTVT